MTIQTIRGIEALTGQSVEIRFDEHYLSCVPAEDAPEGLYLSPGFIDLQVNGFAGVDYGSPFTPEQLARSIEAQWATGVTRLLPTVITNSADAMLAAITNLARARAELGWMGLAMAGLHIEGPHISPEDGPRGAHPKAHVRPPSVDEFERWQEACVGLVKMVTLAPEWPGALHYIEALVKRGVVVALGHTAATAAQIADAVSAGATMATHLGNATAPVKFNSLWDQLAEDRLAASVIADGFHVPASFLKVALRIKRAPKLILVTDAASPAGAAPGLYKLGEVDVESHADGRVTLAGGTRLAGSALTLDRAVSNFQRFSGATLAQAISAVTLNPALLVPGIGRSGPNRGNIADSVEFTVQDGTIQVRRTWLAGREVYSAL